MKLDEIGLSVSNKLHHIFVEILSSILLHKLRAHIVNHSTTSMYSQPKVRLLVEFCSALYEIHLVLPPMPILLYNLHSTPPYLMGPRYENLQGKHQKLNRKMEHSASWTKKLTKSSIF